MFVREFLSPKSPSSQSSHSSHCFSSPLFFSFSFSPPTPNKDYFPLPVHYFLLPSLFLPLLPSIFSSSTRTMAPAARTTLGTTTTEHMTKHWNPGFPPPTLSSSPSFLSCSSSPPHSPLSSPAPPPSSPADKLHDLLRSIFGRKHQLHMKDLSGIIFDKEGTYEVASLSPLILSLLLLTSASPSASLASSRSPLSSSSLSSSSSWPSPSNYAFL